MFISKRLLIILIVITNIVTTNILITNIVITNNNIKINYRNISMTSKKPTLSTKPATTKPATTKPLTTKTLTKNLDPIEVEREWVLKKEDEIERETSIFINITNIARKKLENISLRPNTVHLVIKYIIELIEETPLKGVEQKELALKVMRELFKDLTEGEDEIVLLKLLDDGSISNLIDLVVDATNGKLNINNAVETTLKCATTCLPYCLRSHPKTKT